MENGNKGLTPEKRLTVLRRKQSVTLLTLWLLLGGFVGNCFYLGEYMIGLLLSLIFGGVGIGVTAELFHMWKSLKKHDEALKLETSKRKAEMKAAEKDTESTASVI